MTWTRIRIHFVPARIKDSDSDLDPHQYEMDPKHWRKDDLLNY